MKKPIWMGAAAAAVLTLGVAHYVVRMDRVGPFAEPVYVEIPKGSNTLRIGELLAEAGVVRHPFVFALARLTLPGRGPLAGEYEFTRAATAAEVYARLAKGDVFTIELRVPEGSDVYDIGEAVERAGIASAEAFVKAAGQDEGYLFPNTYRFRRKASVNDVRERMKAEFERVWKQLGGTEAARQRVVTLASLVETEAVHDDERAHIAGVYTKRLEKKMRLECDPTVKYAAKRDGRWRGTIYKSDLASESPYNTYQHAGLPPGPVANPGLASLKAALRPLATEDLYFVARGDRSGGHVFSADYAAHQKAVAAYRHGAKKGTAR